MSVFTRVIFAIGIDSYDRSLRLGGKKSEFSSDQLWGLWLWLSFHVLKGMVVHHVVFVHSVFVSIPDNADDVLRV